MVSQLKRKYGSSSARFGIGVLLAALLVAATWGCTSPSAAVQSADELDIAPALGERYEACRTLAESVSDDAVLLVVSQVRDAEPGVVPAWQYSFVSWEYAQVFQVLYKDGEPALGSTHNSNFTQADLQAVAPVSDIAIDADAAYQRVVEQLTDDEAVESCFVYLMTYVKEDADPTANAMAWFFIFNRPAELAVDDTVITEEAPETDAPPFAYRVDARTGEVMPCAIDEGVFG